jgi:8-oxo-dGTP pyrophosphatase MutT (NUDIX family)
MGKKGQFAAEPDREPRVQSAALPWRLAPGGLEILLVTSRDTRRWVLPKGWPIKGLKSAQTAAREAFEEAGVEGDVARKKVGVFHYDKRLISGRVQHVRVAVYALKVAIEREVWPEAVQREKLWTSPAEAAALVQEPELAALLRQFSPGL